MARLLLPQPDSRAAIEVMAMAFMPYFFSALTNAGASSLRLVPSSAFFKVFVLTFDGSNMLLEFIETITYFETVFLTFFVSLIFFCIFFTFVVFLFIDDLIAFFECLIFFFIDTVSISPEIFSKSGNTVLSSEDVFAVFDETFWLRYMLSDESYCLAYDFNDCDGSKTSETVTQLVSSMALSLSVFIEDNCFFFDDITRFVREALLCAV